MLLLYAELGCRGTTLRPDQNRNVRGGTVSQSAVTSNFQVPLSPNSKHDESACFACSSGCVVHTCCRRQAFSFVFALDATPGPGWRLGMRDPVAPCWCIVRRVTLLSGRAVYALFRRFFLGWGHAGSPGVFASVAILRVVVRRGHKPEAHAFSLALALGQVASPRRYRCPIDGRSYQASRRGVAILDCPRGSNLAREIGRTVCINGAGEEVDGPRPRRCCQHGEGARTLRTGRKVRIGGLGGCDLVLLTNDVRSTSCADPPRETVAFAMSFSGITSCAPT